MSSAPPVLSCGTTSEDDNGKCKDGPLGVGENCYCDTALCNDGEDDDAAEEEADAEKSGSAQVVVAASATALVILQALMR